jgi:hypothetical protein
MLQAMGEGVLLHIAFQALDVHQVGRGRAWLQDSHGCDLVDAVKRCMKKARSPAGGAVRWVGCGGALQVPSLEGSVAATL